MKFAFTATIALLLFANLAQAERQSERAARQAADDEVPESPATHGNTRTDDSPFQDGDEEWVKETKTYSNNEK